MKQEPLRKRVAKRESGFKYWEREKERERERERERVIYKRSSLYWRFVIVAITPKIVATDLIGI